jgi:hypothetical protein
MHEPTAATEHKPESPTLLAVTTAAARLVIQSRVVDRLPAPDPDGETADMSIEHWYFCGAGSAMRSR